jgi:biopolymer transport protein ExbD
MQIGKPAPIRKPIPLTPLVDIVFLLLMFFMLSSTFTKFGALDLDAATGRANGAAAKTFPGAIIVISDALHVTLNGKAVEAGELAHRLNELKGSGVEKAAIRPGPVATVQDLVTVLEVARRSAITDLIVVR